MATFRLTIKTEFQELVDIEYDKCYDAGFQLLFTFFSCTGSPQLLHSEQQDFIRTCSGVHFKPREALHVNVQVLK